MIRTLFASVLTLLLALAPLSAQSSSDCAGGRARGVWNLPVGDQAGRARGLLVDVNGRKLALLARLAAPQRAATPTGGTIDGLLYPVLADGRRLAPIAEVHGTWVVGPEGRGRFEAGIVGLAGIAVDPKQPTAIGKFAGAFSDPVVAGRDPVGTFVGEWAICR